MSIQNRYEIMNEFLGKNPADPSKPQRGAKVAHEGLFALNNLFKRVNESVIDYPHVPKGHVVGLVHFHPQETFYDPASHPAYKHVMGGTYLGELRRTLPLANLIPRIRVAPVTDVPRENGKHTFYSDAYIRDNPYHNTVVTRPESLAENDTLDKAVRIHSKPLDETDPDKINAELSDLIHNDAFQRRILRGLLASVAKD